MYPPHVRAQALELLASGSSISSVSRRLGVSRAAIRAWREQGAALIGGGCTARVGRTHSLRISCDAKWPGIVRDVTHLIEAVRGRGPVNQVSAPGCIVVCGYWNHWPCVFPQHGPGRKHERVLELEPWQRAAVTSYPGPFLRGLFHSDGCRIDNWATQWVAGERKVYHYGRWHFTNYSTDVQRFCTDALDLLEIPWRQSSWTTISVSRREAVARLDSIIGPKS